MTEIEISSGIVLETYDGRRVTINIDRYPNGDSAVTMTPDELRDVAESLKDAVDRMEGNA